jgi:hypothetical protein
MKKGSSHSYERETKHPGGMHGSPKETAEFHGGKESGAGELTIGMGPGNAAMRTKSEGDPGVEKAAKPKGNVKPFNKGKEPDDD